MSAAQYGIVGGGMTSVSDVIVIGAWLLLVVVLLYYHGILATSKVRKSISIRTLASPSSTASADVN